MLTRKKVELDSMMVSSFTHTDLVQKMVEEGLKGVFREVNQPVDDLQVDDCLWHP